MQTAEPNRMAFVRVVLAFLLVVRLVLAFFLVRVSFYQHLHLETHCCILAAVGKLDRLPLSPAHRKALAVTAQGDQVSSDEKQANRPSANPIRFWADFPADLLGH